MILDKKFYERETVTVAKELIGKTLTRKFKGKNYQELLQKQRHIEEKMILQVMQQQK